MARVVPLYARHIVKVKTKDRVNGYSLLRRLCTFIKILIKCSKFLLNTIISVPFINHKMTSQIFQLKLPFS